MHCADLVRTAIPSRAIARLRPALGAPPLAAALRRALAGPLVADVLLPFAVTRLALAAVALLALRIPRDHSVDVSTNGLLSALSRWDGVWYVNIAAHGYGYTHETFTAYAFAPLLPLLMRLLAPLFGGGTDAFVLAGLVIVNTALLVACALVVKLVRLDHDDATARRVPLYLLAFPTSFFLSAVYPEALFLALTVGAFYAARTRRWALAGALAALCVLARPHGVLIVLPLLVEHVHQRWSLPRRLSRDAAWLGLPILVFAAWLGFQQAAFGDALAFVHAQAAWMRRPSAPWDAFPNAFANGRDGWPDVMQALAIVALALYAIPRVRPSYALFAALFVLAPLASGQLYSMIRFTLSIFPLFIGLATLGRHAVFDRVYVPAALLLGGALMLCFASGLLFLA